MGMTQEQLAEHIGRDRSLVGAMERGEKNLSLRKVEFYAELLDVRPIDLLIGPLTVAVGEDADTLRAAQSGDHPPPDARQVRRSRKPRPS